MVDVNKTLAERGSRYGDFFGHAYITQVLKITMRTFRRHNAISQAWDSLDPIHQEALDMIVHKIGRILNGDPNYADNWHDIAGYAKLVEDRIGESQAR